MSIIFKGDTNIRLPVIPEEIEVQTEKRIDIVEINEIGEVGFPMGENLNEIKFSSFFPRFTDSYTDIGTIYMPNYYRHELLKVKESGKPVRLIITEVPVNMMVLITEFNYSAKGGEPDDIYYDIALQEYKEPKIKKIKNKKSKKKKSKKKSRSDNRSVPKTYKVKKGDSLWKICKKFYDDGMKWKKLYNKNKKVVGSNPDLIYPGQKLVMI